MKNTFTFKSELAAAYFPHLSPTAARNKLMSLINSNHTLYNALLDAGYSDMQKEFTPKQMSIIIDNIGSPY